MQSLVPLGPGKFHVVVLVHDYDEEIPYLTFYGGRKQQTTKFSLTF